MDGVLVFLHQCRFHLFRNGGVHIQVLVLRNVIVLYLVGTETVFLDSILVGISFGTCQLVHTAVGTRIHHIMLYVDSLPFLRADKGHGVVAVLELDGVVDQTIAFAQFRTADSFRVHSHQCLHAVAAVNVEQLAGRAHAVSGIDVPPELVVVAQAPVVPIIRPELF